MLSKSIKYAIVVGALLTFIAVAYFFYSFNPSIKQALFIKCGLYTATGIYCPGCGGQRSLHALLNLDIVNALRYNFLFVLLLPLLIGYFLGGIRAFLLNIPSPEIISKAWMGKVIFWGIIAFTLLRNLPFYPFTLLAPPN